MGPIESEPASLLLVSEGLDYDTSDLLSRRPTDANDVLEVFGGAIRTCADREIPIYTLDPRGLYAPEGDVTEVPGEFLNEQHLALLAENRRAVKSLGDLAAMTGGIAIVERNNLKKGLASVAEAMNAYYMLGFVPTSPVGKRFHRLAVKVHRPGARVVVREGYLRW